MVILLDLDGTLTNTAHIKFKPFKDGVEEADISNIPVFAGAKSFIDKLKALGHIPIIVSDSHPKYVKKIANQIFDIQYVSLTDKPNTEITLDFINSITDLKSLYTNHDNFIMIGDSWLDIELGRRLNIRTILTQFYQATTIDPRDGIGQDWKPIKMGPTYYASSFLEIIDIINNPKGNLLALEAVFEGKNSSKAVKFLTRQYSDGFTAFRCLARQQDGECDKYARADQYYQIDNVNRKGEFLESLARSITNYLEGISNHTQFEWHYLTYVSDKRTTTPKNKMKEIFDLVVSNFTKIKVFEWSDSVEGSLRNQPNYKARRDFISENLKIIQGIELNGKNVIVIDDQFTSSATANEISSQLRKRGVKNILFIALFYLILPIESIRSCSNIVDGLVCGNRMKVKIRKSDGHKFYSCVPPRYGGNGCGHIENID
jgi:predicted HAD superfamily phosphohydrolase YqeG